MRKIWVLRGIIVGMIIIIAIAILALPKPLPVKITSMSVMVNAENFDFDQEQKSGLKIRILLKDNKDKNVYVRGEVRHKIYELSDNREGNLIFDTDWYGAGIKLTTDDLKFMAEDRRSLVVFFDDMKPSSYNFGILYLTFTTNGHTFEARQVVPITST